MMVVGKRIVLGFGYKRRTGKSTAGSIAQGFVWQELKRHNRQPDLRNPFLDSFAKPLKKGICKHVFGLTDDQIHGDKKTEIDPFWGITPREIMQRAGTEAMRKGFGEDVWCQSMIKRQRDRTRPLVITDMRFPNEAMTVKKLGGFLVRCDRDVPASPGEDQHTSETALDNYLHWDYVIDNNGDFDDLHDKVAEIVDNVLRRTGWST